LRVRVKLHGVLKTAADKDTLDLEFTGSITVRELVAKTVRTVARPEFENYLIDSDLKDPRPNALILVSGTEIGAREGLDTMLQDGDEVVFLPVAHGGSLLWAPSMGGP
jgi:molybdopterin converting factor small subunit